MNTRESNLMSSETKLHIKNVQNHAWLRICKFLYDIRERNPLSKAESLVDYVNPVWYEIYERNRFISTKIYLTEFQ